MKCYEGAILTVNESNAVYRYLVEDGGRIMYTGDSLPEAYADAERVRLGQRALIPSFADTHQHFASFSTFQAGLNVMDASSNAEIGEMIRAFAARSKGRRLIAFGASPWSVREGRLITREELDAACPDREIMVVKYDGHACIVNTPLLNRMRGKAQGLRGFHPDTGEMNQEAFFRFSDDMSSSLSLSDLMRNMQSAVDFLASRGIGMVHTVSGVGFAGNLDITLEKLFARSLRNGFQLRVFPQPMDVKVALKRKLPRIGGCFECALDGCFGSHDAALSEPYTDAQGGRGVLYYSDEKVAAFCREANRAGLQIEMHAIGDRAFDQAARALKAALDDYPRSDHRHGIIHCCLPTEEGMDICREYGIQMPVQSAFISWKQEPDEYLESILGPERVRRLNPLRTFLRRGISVSFGSDAPCTTPDPISWMDRAVNNPNSEEAVSVQDALRMCTVNGYRAAFDDRTRGSLEPGKTADMAVLSENPYAVPAEKLSSLRVEKLILNGQDYQSCGQSVAAAALAGLFSRSRNY